MGRIMLCLFRGIPCPRHSRNYKKRYNWERGRPRPRHSRYYTKLKFTELHEAKIHGIIRVKLYPIIEFNRLMPLILFRLMPLIFMGRIMLCLCRGRPRPRHSRNYKKHYNWKRGRPRPRHIQRNYTELYNLAKSRIMTCLCRGRGRPLSQLYYQMFFGVTP